MSLSWDWLAEKFEVSRGVSERNVRSMEGLRGFAVFLVFLVHFVGLVHPWVSGNTGLLAFAQSLQTIGHIGVDLFFVLSGYLIYGSLISRQQQFLRFMSRRVERIYPAFTVVFVVYVTLSFAFPAENKIPAPLTAGIIYLIQNFLLLPGLLPVAPMITVAWSLSYEMFYYVSMPLVIALFKLRDRSAVWRTAFFLCLACAMAAYCAVNGGHIRLVMFIAGSTLYEAKNSRRVPSPRSFHGGVALVFGLLSPLIPLEGPGGYTLKCCILALAFFTFCLACFRNPSAWLPHSFSWTPLRWLGNISYSYYLLHGLALKAGFLALSNLLPASGYGSWFFWVLLPLMFWLTLVPSAALFLLVERPFSLVPRMAKGGVASSSLEAPPDNGIRLNEPQTAIRLP